VYGRLYVCKVDCMCVRLTVCVYGRLYVCKVDCMSVRYTAHRKQREIDNPRLSIHLTARVLIHSR